MRVDAAIFPAAGLSGNDRIEVLGFQRFLSLPAHDREEHLPDGRTVTRFEWPWLAYAKGENGPPPRLWWLEDELWPGGDQA